MTDVRRRGRRRRRQGKGREIEGKTTVEKWKNDSLYVERGTQMRVRMVKRDIIASR